MEQGARDQNEGVRHLRVQGYNLLGHFSIRVLPHTSYWDIGYRMVEGRICLGALGFGIVCCEVWGMVGCLDFFFALGFGAELGGGLCFGLWFGFW